MEKKLSQKKENSLFDQLKLMKNCPQCKAEYTKEGIEVVEEKSSTHLVHLTCPSCFNALLAVVVVSKLGMSSVGMFTDLNAVDVRRLYGKNAITEEQILDFHDFLFKNSKEFIHLLTS